MNKIILKYNHYVIKLELLAVNKSIRLSLDALNY